MVNAFLNALQERMEAGELTDRTYNVYHATCVKIVKVRCWQASYIASYTRCETKQR